MHFVNGVTKNALLHCESLFKARSFIDRALRSWDWILSQLLQCVIDFHESTFNPSNTDVGGALIKRFFDFYHRHTGFERIRRSLMKTGYAADGCQRSQSDHGAIFNRHFAGFRHFFFKKVVFNR